jgi:hypothetical protein
MPYTSVWPSDCNLVITAKITEEFYLKFDIWDSLKFVGRVQIYSRIKP